MRRVNCLVVVRMGLLIHVSRMSGSRVPRVLVGKVYAWQTPTSKVCLLHVLISYREVILATEHLLVMAQHIFVIQWNVINYEVFLVSLEQSCIPTPTQIAMGPE
ncbi:hypothetical protein F5Y08DRAFT_257739 [Xylaria arbuscula]|nr:hypothetical protein F5Y08DRAFT_257739 [Xylaria arbuscula]